MAKDAKEQIDSINANLLIFAEVNKAKKVKTSEGNFSVVQVTKDSFDSSEFKKDHAELYKKYTKSKTGNPYIR